MINQIFTAMSEWIPWMQYSFMRNALMAVLILAPTFGILSTMVVNNRMAFFSDSIGHSTLTGIGIGILLGLKSPLWSMILFAIIFSVFIVWVKNTNTISTDTIIGVFSSTAVALGLVILSKGGSFNKYSYLLIGDLLSITPSEIVLLAVALILVIIFWMFVFNALLVVSINSSLAASRGKKVLLTEILFTVLVAIVVTLSIRWIGLLIINSLLILPGAAARNISNNMRQYHIISVAIALITGISGLVLSYYWGASTGASITLLCAGVYFITFAFRYRFA